LLLRRLQRRETHAAQAAASEAASASHACTYTATSGAAEAPCGGCEAAGVHEASARRQTGRPLQKRHASTAAAAAAAR